RRSRGPWGPPVRAVTGVMKPGEPIRSRRFGHPRAGGRRGEKHEGRGLLPALRFQRPTTPKDLVLQNRQLLLAGERRRTQLIEVHATCHRTTFLVRSVPTQIVVLATFEHTVRELLHPATADV